MTNRILIAFGALFILLVLLIFRPVPIVKESKANVTKGVVQSITEGGVHDVVFRLRDHPTTYYINRGLEQGLNLDTLRNQLIGNEVIIKYPSYWTPLDWNNKIKHLSKLEFNGVVLFNELKPDE